MRDWYEIEFTPNHATEKPKRYFATDLLIAGKTVEQIEDESYRRGFRDALRYVRDNTKELEAGMERYK